MSNHFTAMGLPVREPEDLSRVIGTALRGAAVEPAGGRLTLAVWREEPGAGVDVLLRKARWRGEPTVECATPQFDGAGRQTVRVTSVVDDGECPGCALAMIEVLDGGQMLYPLAVAPARVVAVRPRLEELARSAEPIAASIVFVAEEIEVYADEAAFSAAQDTGGDFPGFATESLVPAGLFSGGERPASAALVHGVVTAARKVAGTTFDAPFWHLTVRTLGGEFDVVAGTEGVGEVAMGNVVAVQAWVCGRIGDVA